jgi:FdhE protein
MGAAPSSSVEARSPYIERLARARQLAAEHPAARELLIFYAAVAEYQTALFQRSTSELRADVPFDAALDRDAVLAAVPPFLKWLPSVAPRRLSEDAAAMLEIDRARWAELFDEYLAEQRAVASDQHSATDFVLEAIAQPFAEATAIPRRTSAPAGTPSKRCPICSGRAVAGLLRERGHGAGRALVCGLCWTEWDFPRVSCPACQEGRFDALPVYAADEFAHVRIDACDSCRTYVKTIDLSKNALASPAADDFATLPLDLWARGEGYARLRPNLLRT